MLFFGLGFLLAQLFDAVEVFLLAQLSYAVEDLKLHKDLGLQPVFRDF